MTWNGGYQGSGGASSRARLLIPVLHLLFEKSDGQYLPVPIPFDRVLTQLGKRRVSLPLLFFLSLPPIFSRKTFPSSANIFFFFCKRLEKKPRYLKDKREREREVSQGRDECTTIDVSQLSHDDEEREETLNGIRSRHAPSLRGASLSEIREPSN